MRLVFVDPAGAHDTISCQRPPASAGWRDAGHAPAAADLPVLVFLLESNREGYTNLGPPGPSADSSSRPPRTQRSPRPSRDGGILSRPG